MLYVRTHVFLVSLHLCSRPSVSSAPLVALCFCVCLCVWRGVSRNVKEENGGKQTLCDKSRTHSSTLPSSFSLSRSLPPWENQTGGLGLLEKLRGVEVACTTACLVCVSV